LKMKVFLMEVGTAVGCRSGTYSFDKYR
jgi:hypothetical protein